MDRASSGLPFAASTEPTCAHVDPGQHRQNALLQPSPGERPPPVDHGSRLPSVLCLPNKSLLKNTVRLALEPLRPAPSCPERNLEGL